jgi:molybdopterin synthase catalytic subunit
MKIKVIFFASFRERVGTREKEIELPDDSTVQSFKILLAEQFPTLHPYLPLMIVSINRNFAFDHDRIPDFAEVAVFPPVSGGEDIYPTIIMVTEQEIDMGAIVQQITSEKTGAACIFSGMVRGISERGSQQRTDYLEYEAYEPMAEEKMRQIALEIRDQWPSIQGIALVQRIGVLFPRTPTVLIACTAAHRDTGVFEAARYGIDRLKEIVPVWKKETGPSGEAWIDGNYLPGSDDQ